MDVTHWPRWIEVAAGVPAAAIATYLMMHTPKFLKGWLWGLALFGYTPKQRANCGFIIRRIMRKGTAVRSLLVVGLTLACASLLFPAIARAQNVSETGTAGKYSLTLKVLPAESFKGPHAEMMRDGGAMADMAHGEAAPNHHLVVFVDEKGKPVEDAKVTISYRRLSPKPAKWMSLPVVRMHVEGKGMETTHYGNNVKLAPGNYEARVTVNGKGPATFHFAL